ncbi:MAG: DUF998 domain-containing protein [Candidatus Saccharibacteria bacterium]|nr:DUF998 domain-containing protein [Candidatus Saccharibacteria bacterium]
MSFRIAGSLLWVSSLQYFVVQIIAAAAFEGGFSIASNTISDLGNSVCGLYGDRYVCSPLHPLMNASFILVGTTQLLGAALLYKSMKSSRLRLFGFGSMVLAGVGTIVVGIFPENTIGTLHVIGAALPFVFGNLSMIALGSQLKLPRWLKTYSYVSGILGLLALVLFLLKMYPGIGQGGMERIVAYPQTMWMVVVGLNYLYHKKTRGAATGRG